MSLICGAPHSQGVIVGGGPSRRGVVVVPRSWEHRPPVALPPFTMAAASPSSSESSRDSDDRRSFSQPPSPHDASSYSPVVPSPSAAVPTAVTTRVGKPGRTPSRYDWSKHMPTIKRLYIDEDKTLNQVLEIMKEEHDFVAT